MFFVKRFVNSFGVVENEVLSKSLIKSSLVMDYVQMIIDKFFYSSVISFHVCIDLGHLG